MKKFQLPLMIILCLFSCKKEKSENLCNNNSLISQVKIEDEILQGLTYNSNCVIYESVQPYSYKKYTYDTQNRLIKTEQAISFNPLSCVMIPGMSEEEDPRKAKISNYTEFEYNTSGKLSKKLYYIINTDTPELTSYELFEYDSTNIIKISLYNPENQLSLYQTFKYDEVGNVIRVEFYILENYENVLLQNYSIYEFDNQKNPFTIFSNEGIPGVFTNKNNITKTTTINYYSGVENSNSNVYSYEYNDAGYPVKVNNEDYLYGQ
jgi:hypothetical protein